MPRIAGIDIPDKKKILFSLQYIHGIGPKGAEKILEKTGIDPNRRLADPYGGSGLDRPTGLRPDCVCDERQDRYSADPADADSDVFGVKYRLDQIDIFLKIASGM